MGSQTADLITGLVLIVLGVVVILIRPTKRAAREPGARGQVIRANIAGAIAVVVGLIGVVSTVRR